MDKYLRIGFCALTLYVSSPLAKAQQLVEFDYNTAKTVQTSQPMGLLIIDNGAFSFEFARDSRKTRDTVRVVLQDKIQDTTTIRESFQYSPGERFEAFAIEETRKIQGELRNIRYRIEAVNFTPNCTTYWIELVPEQEKNK